MFDAVIQVDSVGNVPEEFKWFDSTIKTQDFLDMNSSDFFVFSMNEIVTAIPGLGDAMRSSQMEVIGEVKAAGINDVGMITEMKRKK